MIQAIGNSPVLPNGMTVPLTPAIRAGDFLFISGQLGLDDANRLVAEDIAAQTRQCVLRLQNLLKLAGGDLQQIVKMSVWLTDPTDFPAFNNVYRELFAQRPPARSTVVSGLLIPGARIEMDAIAYLP